MKIEIDKLSNSLEGFMDKIGYRPDRKKFGEERSFHRSLRSGSFPRFHIYVDEKENSWVLKIHLDQKKASYDSQTAHGGEYDSPIVKKEVERIKKKVKLFRQN